MENENSKSKNRTAKYILDGLKNKGLSKDSLQLIHGWLLHKSGDDLAKEEPLEKLFMDGFPDSHTPSSKAYHMLDKFQDKVKTLEKPAVRKLSLQKRLLKVAAVLLPLLIASGIGIMMFNQTGIETVANEAEYLVLAASDLPRRMVLPCGSEIVLNAGSEIRYDEETYIKDRTVHLSGEAFFSVTTSASPFIVKTYDLSVKVLGTEFYVRSLSQSETTEVSLVSGKVEIEFFDDVITLAPNQELVYDKKSGNSTIGSFDVDRIERWSTTINLNHIRLDTALYAIGNYFGVEMILDKRTPVDKLVRGGFYNETLNEILEILHLVMDNFDYEIKGDKVYIYGR